MVVSGEDYQQKKCLRNNMREIKFRKWQHKEMKKVFTLRMFEHTGLWHHQADEEDYPIIMQYTGLKDKKGVEIYEGDIVMGGKEWFNHRVEQNIELIEDIAKLPTERGDWSIDACNYEVIGNTYENPELLK
jgi:hypothetical protein